MNDDLLLRLFQRHYSEPGTALCRIKRHIASVDLPFELQSQLREVPFPPQPGLPKGMPSFVYYYTPNTRRGTEQPTPNEPLHPSFLNACDGIGLNLGCPVRLLRALDALEQLPLADQQSPRLGLQTSTDHLSTVEELLWLTGWNMSTSARRGGRFAGVPCDIDWALIADGCLLYLEAKFRRSDWPRLSDHGTFSRVGEGFLSSAVHKFPHPPQAAALHVVGITTFDNIDEDIMHDIGLDLERNPQIHAVVIRSMLQMTHVISLSQPIRDTVLNLLKTPIASDYPSNHGIFYQREQRDKRVASRQTQRISGPKSKALCWSIRPTGLIPIFSPDPDIYRAEIPSRGDDGEPHFRIVPKYLMPPEP